VAAEEDREDREEEGEELRLWEEKEVRLWEQKVHPWEGRATQHCEPGRR
jgi:hypothetical protein